MIYGTYLSAAGMAGEQARQDLIANNLANVETTGFKRILTLFQERAPQPSGRQWQNMTGGRWTLPTQVDLSQGGFEDTGDPLDLALVGEGYLTVAQEGQSRLTRDGRLAINQQGLLAMAGDPETLVLNDAGLPIDLAGAAAGDLNIGTDGTIRHARTNEVIARLGLATADAVRPMGGSMLEPLSPPRPVGADLEVRAGQLERSNVDPTVELTRLIEAGRLLEANANMIRYQDTSLGRLIEASRIG